MLENDVVENFENFPEPSRADLLRGWLVTHRVNHGVLAEHLGLKRSTATNHVGSDEVPGTVLAKLREFRSPYTGQAIPEAYLPRASRGKRGPVPNQKDGDNAVAV